MLGYSRGLPNRYRQPGISRSAPAHFVHAAIRISDGKGGDGQIHFLEIHLQDDEKEVRGAGADRHRGY